MFGVVFDTAGLQVESVTQCQTIDQSQDVFFKSSREHRDQEAAVVALRSIPSALSVN